MPLTDTEEAEIRARCEAATAGPWSTDDYDMDVIGDKYRIIATAELKKKGVAAFVALAGPTKKRGHDSEFMAHAREDIPRLLATIDALRAKEAAGG